MKKVIIFSGAGLSAESGIRTFRDSNGLWEEYDVKEVCSVEGWLKNRQKVTQFYNDRRKDLEHKKPNAAHAMIADLKKRYKDSIYVVTQNVDDLLEKAGCEDVVHIHGTLTDLRCEDCGNLFYIGYKPQDNMKCPNCKSDYVRHNVVMFGEAAPKYKDMEDAINDSSMLVVIGTSSSVVNIAWYAQWFENSIINNLEENEFADSFFKIKYIEKATVAANKIQNDIKNFLGE